MSKRKEVKKYSKSEYRRDLATVYVQTAVDFALLYGPAVALGIGSIACILGGHNILKKRNVAIIAAYNAVEKSFSNYRKRVVEKYGAGEDRELKYGITRETEVEVVYDENGKEIDRIKKEVEVFDPNGLSQYARFFDETCSQWTKDPNYNQTYLIHQQNFANDLLNSKGHVFLNEVYDLLGVPRTPEASQVGWVKGCGGDDFVDFGIFNADSDRARAFVNGHERSILLDFNVDGVMYHLI